MALNATTAWRIRPTGLEANGGGFDPGLTTNMLTDGAATSATGNSPVFGSASYNFVAGDVGAAVYIAAGTNWVPGWYPIVSVAANQATLAAAIDPLRGNGILANGDAPLTAGCASTASPTGATWSIDYSWLATAPKSASDLTSTASTTATSVSGGLHKGMIGNVLRLASGSGTTPGYYAVVNVASGTSMTLDAASGTYTVGVFKIGGAFLHPMSLATSGSVGTFGALTTPLAPGHMVFVRGAGTDTPGSVDYACDDGYRIFPSGDLTNGSAKWISYNGRARIGYNGLFAYQTDLHLAVGLYGDITTFTFSGYGFLGLGNGSAHDCVFDQHGNDATLFTTLKSSLTQCRFIDSSNSSAGTQPVVETQHVGALISACVFDGVKGPAIALHGRCASVRWTYIINGKSDGIQQLADDSTKYVDEIEGCVLYNNAGHALNFSTGGFGLTKMTNTIVANHTGGSKYGLNAADSLAVNKRLVRHLFDYNCWFGNTNNFNGWALGTHDVTLDPQFTNAGSKDFSVGTNMKAIGFPSLLPFG